MEIPLKSHQNHFIHFMGEKMGHFRTGWDQHTLFLAMTFKSFYGLSGLVDCYITNCKDPPCY